MDGAGSLAWLAGKEVAFTGRLASLTRAEAAELVRSFGGEHVDDLTRQTAFLVVGQEGLPLSRNGRLTRKLQRARFLQVTGRPVILTEQEFFARLGLAASADGVHRRYTTAQLCRLLRIPRDRLRSWIRHNLIQPIATAHGVGFFDFQQVTAVKTLWDLTRAGVTPGQIRRSLEQLHHWLPDVAEPLAKLAVIERGGRLLFRLDEGQLAEPTGQLQLDFGDEPVPSRAVIESGPRSADDWWELGCDLESRGRLEEAAQAYRQALLAGGPDARLCFNLGNVLYALGQKGQAAERFRQAVELDPAMAEAWNNLGNALAELDQGDEARAAFEEALKRNPVYADTHYNLADLLEQLGRGADARPHWQAYLKLEPVGRWAAYARKRLPPRLG
jgi:tetratricopeptide (TPR) repeat protein